MRHALFQAYSQRSRPLSSMGGLVSVLFLTSLPQPGFFLVSAVLGTTCDTAAAVTLFCSWPGRLSNRDMSFASLKHYARLTPLRERDKAGL